MKKKLNFVLLCTALCVFGGAIIICPDRYVSCCFNGFLVWAECVLPSLFPFMVITLIFVKTGFAEKAALPLRRAAYKLKLPPAAAVCFLLAVCSGYPAGSRVVSEFCENGSVSRKDCPKVAYLCSASGPLFIIGSVGVKMFGDRILGYKILLAHVFAVLSVSLIISLLSKPCEKASLNRPAPDKNALYNAFYGAVVAVCVAGGFIAFFYVFATFASDFKLTYPLQALLNSFMDENVAAAVCTGIIEATTGCLQLAGAGGNAAFAGFLITFGGLSILLQQLSYLVPAGVKPLKFIAVKFIQGVVCFLVLLLIL